MDEKKKSDTIRDQPATGKTHGAAPVTKAEGTSASDCTTDMRKLAGKRPAPPPSLDANQSLAFLQAGTQPGSLGRLGHFEVLEILGRGGFGIVLKARDEKLQRFVAIKVLAGQFAGSTMSRSRFLREARAAAKVSSKFVVNIFAVEEQPLPYLVMEHVSGKNLQDRIDQEGPMPVHDILRIGAEIAEGLAAAHGRGLIHRDIKPANILLETRPGAAVPRAKITDFGLARAVDDTSLTRTGSIAGTPSYMSPEQARGEKLDHRSDLFSLGSVLYTMCTGQLPFSAPKPLGVLKRVCDDTPTAIREINPAIPSGLVAVINKLLAKNAGERFQTAAAVAKQLQQFSAKVESRRVGAAVGGDLLAEAAPAAESGETPAEVTDCGRSTKAIWLAAAAALMIVVGGVTAFVMLRQPAGTGAASFQPAAVPTETFADAVARADDWLAKRAALQPAPVREKNLVVLARQASGWPRVAAVHILRENWPQARTALKNAAEERDAATDVVDLLSALVHEQAGQDDEADARLVLAMAKTASQSDAAFRDLVLETATGRLDKAPQNAALRLARARLQHRMGRTADALVDFAQYRKLTSSRSVTREDVRLLEDFAASLLTQEDRLEDAADAYRDLAQYNPKDVRYQSGLATAFLNLGRWSESIAAWDQAEAALPNNQAIRNNIATIRRFQALEGRLPAIRGNSYQPSNNVERFDLIQICRIRKVHDIASRLYADSFAADPEIAERPNASHRYDAACAAARAQTAKEADLPGLTDDRRAALRRQAHAWLMADLTAIDKRLDARNVVGALYAAEQLPRWRKDPALASLREPAELSKLANQERNDWQALWVRADETLARIRDSIKDTNLEGTLTARETSQTHSATMQAGATYVLELESSAFDVVLILEGADGAKVAENDDAAPGHLNARITFKPTAGGVYRVVATSFMQRGAGPYRLRIRECFAK